MINELSTILIHGLKKGYEGLAQGLVILRQKPSFDEMEQILRDKDQRHATMKNIHDGGSSTSASTSTMPFFQ